MTYQVLARKWRPKDFASLVGQEHVVRALTHALDGGRLHHAYLFTGTRGVGKTTLSRIFAKALNCETGVTSTPCGVCRACREIDEGRFVDYVEMDAASNRGVDEMAALLERAVYAPVDARFKVYMIDEVHMLTNHAFNAMLKTLEEPPAHVKFILATTDPQKIPVTVLSRCLQFNLKQMPAGHIVTHLEHILGEEHVPHETQALRLLARAADGSMRDALSLTDQAIAYSANEVTEEAVRGMLGALDQSYLIRLLDALADGDGAAVLSVADEMALRSLSFSTALQDLASLLHRIAWAQFAPASVLDEWPEAADLRRFADALSAEHVQLFYQIATIGRSELGLAPDEYAGFTMTLLRMLAFEPAPGGGGGAAPSGGATGRAGASGVARSGKSSAGAAVAAAQNVTGARQAAGPAPETAAVSATPASATKTSAGVVEAAAAPEQGAAPDDSVAARRDVNAQNIDDDAGANKANKATHATEPATATPVAIPTQHANAVTPDANASSNGVSFDGAASGPDEVSVRDSAAVESDVAVSGDASAASAVDASIAVEAEALAETERVETQVTPLVEASPIHAANVANESSTADAADEPNAANEPADIPTPTPDAAASRAPTRPGLRVGAPVAASTSPSPAIAAPSPVVAAPRRAGGASAALDVLRSAGLKVSSDRGRASAAGASPAPRVNVPVPTPNGPRRAAPENGGVSAASNQASGAAPSRAPAQRNSQPQSQGNSVPPWDDIPLDDYVPLASDDAYFASPDDNYMPSFDDGPDDVRMPSAPAAAPAVVDARPLPPAIALDAIGFDGDWPALAAGLALKGISYQLAFNSELMAIEGGVLKLNVPVPQYAEASQVAKLKTALAERLGRTVEVQVEVGAARRTAAAADAAARAQRQKEAEREIGTDPFVQSLIREFGASIVPGSIRPVSADVQGTQGGASAAH